MNQKSRIGEHRSPRSDRQARSKTMTILATTAEVDLIDRMAIKAGLSRGRFLAQMVNLGIRAMSEVKP